MSAPKLHIFFLFILSGLIASCTHKPDLTQGAISLFDAYNKVLAKTDTCSQPNHRNIYSVSGEMPAVDYLKPNGKDSLVSYVAGISAEYGNALFTNWECNKQRYIFNGICPPQTIHYPYECDTLEIKAPYLVKFIEVSALQKLKPDITALTSANNTLPFFGLTDVVKIESYHLEPRKGFIDENYHGRYIDPTAELGIICDLKLKSGAVKQCYILTDYLGTMHWKNPMD